MRFLNFFFQFLLKKLLFLKKKEKEIKD